MDVPLFEQVAEAVQSLTPADLGQLRTRFHRRGVKAWFGGEKPDREHYEAQVIARRHVDGVDGLAVEIGFHAEHKEPERNVAAIDKLQAVESKWRKRLGNEADVGEFLGSDQWRRISEVWIEPDLDDPDLALELSTRLVDYLMAIEPHRSS